MNDIQITAEPVAPEVVTQEQPKEGQFVQTVQDIGTEEGTRVN